MRTLHALPVGTTLSRAHPDLPRAQLHSGVTLPAHESAGKVDAAFFDIAYWVIGAPPDSAATYFDLIVRFWNRSGWPIRTDRDSGPRAAYTRTPDHVGLSVRGSIDGHVSLSGSTPPFAVDSSVGPPLPASIEHPLTAPDRFNPTPGRRTGDAVRRTLGADTAADQTKPDS
ncbi:hypothetical protein [Nocardia sp. NPDC019395]|uniref:hypothetical protein n=1 Tax=Nocardia sp. NPDC019395 TaxID=3154686 RepID=UPI0033C0473D